MLTERGVAFIVTRLAKGEDPGRTGQPRPAAESVSRDGIASLARKTAEAVAQLQAEFPSAPDLKTVARHPFYGDLNAVSWLLTLPNHYSGHIGALERGTRSAL